jgi:hypothetical protein
LVHIFVCIYFICLTTALHVILSNINVNNPETWMSYPLVNKALRFSGRGGELQVTETEVLPLLANEILVKVVAASINPVDIQVWRNGMVSIVAGDKGMGRDFSGTIVSVGDDVKGWVKGDDIFGLLFEVVSRFRSVWASANLSISSVRVLSVNISILTQRPLQWPKSRGVSRMKWRLPFRW